MTSFLRACASVCIATAFAGSLPATELVKSIDLYSAPTVKIGSVKSGTKFQALGTQGNYTRIRVDSGGIQLTGMFLTSDLSNTASAVSAVTGKFSSLVSHQYHSRGRVTADFTIAIKTSEKEIMRPMIYAMVLGKDKKNGSFWLSKGYMLVDKDLIPYRLDRPEVVSKKQRIISLSALKFANIKSALMPEMKKEELAAARMELWHNGHLLDAWDSNTPTKIRAKKIPPDWHTRKPGLVQ